MAGEASFVLFRCVGVRQIKAWQVWSVVVVWGWFCLGQAGAAGLVWGVSFVSSSSGRVRLVEARQAR